MGNKGKVALLLGKGLEGVCGRRWLCAGWGSRPRAEKVVMLHSS